jgi:hypothetical protein
MTIVRLFGRPHGSRLRVWRAARLERRYVRGDAPCPRGHLERIGEAEQHGLAPGAAREGRAVRIFGCLFRSDPRDHAGRHADTGVTRLGANGKAGATGKQMGVELDAISSVFLAARQRGRSRSARGSRQCRWSHPSALDRLLTKRHATSTHSARGSGRPVTSRPRTRRSNSALRNLGMLQTDITSPAGRSRAGSPDFVAPQEPIWRADKPHRFADQQRPRRSASVHPR